MMEQLSERNKLAGEVRGSKRVSWVQNIREWVRNDATHLLALRERDKEAMYD